MTSPFQNIPQELKSLDQWCCWKYGPKRPNGKRSKPPCTPGGDLVASQNVKCSFAECVSAIGKDGIAGIGFHLFKENQIVATDYDDCIDCKNEPNVGNGIVIVSALPLYMLAAGVFIMPPCPSGSILFVNEPSKLVIKENVIVLGC